MEGRFLHLNQGEFYIYSTDGSLQGIDTIKVQGGRFAYEMECEDPSTLVLVFPNFSEQPVFAEPGKTVNIKGDASHLKALTVEGTKDNELMNKFRQQVINSSPQEQTRFAEQFVLDHPESQVSVYLLRRYFIQVPRPDLRKASRLAETLAQKQPRNGALNNLRHQLKNAGEAFVGDRIPSFQGTDVNGRSIGTQTVAAAPVGVIFTWATWSYESMSFSRTLVQLERESAGRMKVLGICLEGSRKTCRDHLHLDSVPWPTVCDEQMLEGKLVNQLGLHFLPSSLLLQKGKVVGRNLSSREMEDKVKELLGK